MSGLVLWVYVVKEGGVVVVVVASVGWWSVGAATVLNVRSLSNFLEEALAAAENSEAPHSEYRLSRRWELARSLRRSMRMKRRFLFVHWGDIMGVSIYSM